MERRRKFAQTFQYQTTKTLRAVLCCQTLANYNNGYPCKNRAQFVWSTARSYAINFLNVLALVYSEGEAADIPGSSAFERINLSPFTKDFRAGGRLWAY